ncbi:hypothetical protein VOLCADRAFT_127367 [Volvox carteri f. nagariensis]|uniref:Uncharacterized protein ssa12 n=1 Tax=Volvox carteri f. nagariensis TaxID=3068 RepID=D8U5U3_VOLCA|nr:uncharacterized protein VOLCADRAFT_127367 [Volvox carteri f. nagariensis]EFJ44981.1 hypothetical protein VOLCADRAFT_127367 [Volvox carteri f. nagariensis]|eukprot:XP_002953952.1 hypothetical protein VOLCADRAFT_127367 [Volvox carteri f. nagariensis]
MEGVLNTAQTILTGYDVTLQRQIRSEERAWRAEDLAYRQHERELARQEQQFMLEERAFLATQIQQAHLDNARALWQRFVNRNRAEVQEKAEQLKALSALAALLAGFALVRYVEHRVRVLGTHAVHDPCADDNRRYPKCSFLEFQFVVDANYNRALLPLFALTTSITVGVEVAAVVLCSLMLASIMRIGKMYVNEQEEAEFMHRCQIFITQYRPPAPSRTFSAYWAHRCEKEWSTAFRLFSIGAPCFFINLALAGWIKFHQAPTPTAAGLVTCCMGIALLWNLYTHRKWGKYLLQDEAAEQVTHGCVRRRMFYQFPLPVAPDCTCIMGRLLVLPQPISGCL